MRGATSLPTRRTRQCASISLGNSPAGGGPTRRASSCESCFSGGALRRMQSSSGTPPDRHVRTGKHAHRPVPRVAAALVVAVCSASAQSEWRDLTSELGLSFTHRRGRHRDALPARDDGRRGGGPRLRRRRLARPLLRAVRLAGRGVGERRQSALSQRRRATIRRCDARGGSSRCRRLRSGGRGGRLRRRRLDRPLPAAVWPQRAAPQPRRRDLRGGRLRVGRGGPLLEQQRRLLRSRSRWRPRPLRRQLPRLPRRGACRVQRRNSSASRCTATPTPTRCRPIGTS